MALAMRAEEYSISKDGLMQSLNADSAVLDGTLWVISKDTR